MQEYFKILGLPETATDEEIEAAYNKLKEKYSRERFYEGEIGNAAAKNLTKLETAYHEIKDARKNQASAPGTEPDSLLEIETLIKKGKYSEAQTALDNISDRSAEWHYLQSVLFYKKNWMNDSKKQLEIAMNMDPYNTKYSDSYTKLKQKMEFNENQFRSGNAGYAAGGGQQNAQYNGEQRQMGGGCGNDCLSFCATWCCLDMLCSMCCR